MFILSNILLLCTLGFAVGHGGNFYGLLSLYTEKNNTDCAYSIFSEQHANRMVHLKLNIGDTTEAFSFRTIGTTSSVEEDPALRFRAIINRVLFGQEHEVPQTALQIGAIISVILNETAYPVNVTKTPVLETGPQEDVDLLAHFPSGQVMRGELFYNRSAVHLPTAEFMHRGHCYLELNWDYMQTAINAFGIIQGGNLDDIMRLPAHYVLKSARTISMMKITREKLVAMWLVVKGDRKPVQVPYETLENFRPLFKYLSGREISKLNLSDPRIVMFIGTHPDLNRHQVGVVASQYIRRNVNWMDPKYLNIMNNLLCGVPVTLMRNAPESTFLQMSDQLFFHIRACDPLQRRFYLAMMSKTQILGKANSWSARDVHRLGLLLTEVDGPDLATIIPESCAGITAQLVVEMSIHNLQYMTKRQLLYLKAKPFNILAKKMKYFDLALRQSNSAKRIAAMWSYLLIIFKIQVLQQ